MVACNIIELPLMRSSSKNLLKSMGCAFGFAFGLKSMFEGRHYLESRVLVVASDAAEQLEDIWTSGRSNIFIYVYVCVAAHMVLL